MALVSTRSLTPWPSAVINVSSGDADWAVTAGVRGPGHLAEGDVPGARLGPVARDLVQPLLDLRLRRHRHLHPPPRLRLLDPLSDEPVDLRPPRWCADTFTASA